MNTNSYSEYPKYLRRYFCASVSCASSGRLFGPGRLPPHRISKRCFANKNWCFDSDHHLACSLIHGQSSVLHSKFASPCVPSSVDENFASLLRSLTIIIFLPEYDIFIASRIPVLTQIVQWHITDRSSNSAAPGPLPPPPVPAGRGVHWGLRGGSRHRYPGSPGFPSVSHPQSEFSPIEHIFNKVILQTLCRSHISPFIWIFLTSSSNNVPPKH